MLTSEGRSETRSTHDANSSGRERDGGEDIGSRRSVRGLAVELVGRTIARERPVHQ